jgi:hypothetical protein
MRVAHDTQWTYTATLDKLHDKAKAAEPYAKANGDGNTKANADANAHSAGPVAGHMHAAVIMSVLWNRWPPESGQAAPPEPARAIPPATGRAAGGIRATMPADSANRGAARR